MNIALIILAIAGAAALAFFLFKKFTAPESFEQMLVRTEGCTVAQITGHSDGEAPDAQKLYAAFCRGRKRMAAIYPQAAKVQMSAITFNRAKLVWVAEKPYPLFSSTGDGSNLVRGITTLVPPFTQYSYEEVVEHEACHAIGGILDGQKARTAAAIAAPQDADQTAFTMFYEILCHGTTDDPLGTPGNRASCVNAYSGPPNPLITTAATTPATATPS